MADDRLRITRPRPIPCAVLTSFWCVFFTTGGHADDVEIETQRTAVLLTRGACPSDDGWPELEKRIRQELTVSGVNVVEAAGCALSETLPEDLFDAAEKHQADAAVAVVITSNQPPTFAMLITDDTAPQPFFKELKLDVAVSEAGVEVAALRAQEALLAAMFEGAISTASQAVTLEPTTEDDEPIATGDSSDEPRGPAGPVSDSLSPTKTVSIRSLGLAPKSHRVHLSAAMGGAWAPGGVGMRGSVLAGVRWAPPEPVLLGVDMAVSVLGADVETREAKASVDLLVARLHAAWTPSLPISWLRPALGARAGVAYVWSKGSSDTIDDLRKVDAVLFCGGGFAELAIALTERLALPITAGLGAIAPGVSIRFGDVPVARLRPLLIEAGLGLTLVLG